MFPVFTNLNYNFEKVFSRIWIYVNRLKSTDGEIVIRNNPYTEAGFGDVLVAQSKVYKYKHDGIDWDYGGRSASIRSFKLQGELADN